MALTVTNKLTNSILDPQLVKILQDLENKIPERSHFTPYSASIGKDDIGIVMFAIADEYVTPPFLGSLFGDRKTYGKFVIGLIVCNQILIDDWQTLYKLSLLLGDTLPDLGGYIYFCGNGWVEEMFNVTSNGDAVDTTLTIIHNQSQKIQFSNALLIGNTII